MKNVNLDVLASVYEATMGRTGDPRASLAAVLEAANPKPNSDAYALVEAISDAHGVPVARVLGRTKVRRVVHCRRMVWHLLQISGWTTTKIANEWDVDPSAVTHGLQSFDSRLARSAELRAHVEWFANNTKQRRQSA